MKKERRRLRRRGFSYYMRMFNHRTGKVVGHLSDISQEGFLLDCQEPILLDVEYQLRLELSPNLADKNLLVFTAHCKWCRLDPTDSVTYRAGFQIVNMSPDDRLIFNRMFERYGSDDHMKSSSDYLWK